MSSAFQVQCLLIKISKKIGVLLMKMTILPMAAKNELKILLMDKAVVTLLILSLCDGGRAFAYYFLCSFHYIMAMKEVVDLREPKYHLYLSDDEYRQVYQSLINLKNSLIAEGKYTDAVDDVLCKILSAKRKKVKIKNNI